MRSLKPYRRYPDEIKEEIARSGNIYLFPELKIPRTTAQYWTRKKRDRFQHTSAEKLDLIYKRHAEHLKYELDKERALRRLLETVRRLFPHDFRTRVLKLRSSRAQIIVAIGLSKSAYLRWTSELSFCKRTQSLCDRRNPRRSKETSL